MNGTLHAEGGRSVLRFERRLAHPPEKVWRALTEPEHLAHWFPADIVGERAAGASIEFVFRNAAAPTQPGRIERFEPPHLLEYTWGDSVLRWELRPDGSGCLLLFTHVFDDRAGAASFASGWQGCLDALANVLEGRPVEWPARYVELHELYVERFALGEGSIQESPGGWTARFERQLPHPIETVWATLTEADPSGPGEAELAVGSPVPPRFSNPFVSAGAIAAVDPPVCLEYDWWFERKPVGRVRWELTQGPGGARVILTQSVPRNLANQRAIALAAWHTHLEVLARRLRSKIDCPWPAERTEELRRHYAARL